jgi:hypothetical protein
MVTAVAAGIVAPALPTTATAEPALAPSHDNIRDVAQARPAKRSSRRRKRGNMPEGWTWPPSRQMRAAGKACLAELDALGVGWKRASKRRKIATPITLTSLEMGGVQMVSVYREPPFVMDCHLALQLARKLPELYQLGLRELHFSRIFEYTRVRTRGRQLRALSRHALGLAMDVRWLVDVHGHKAVVLDDYPKGDELLLGFERAVSDTDEFRTLLTPANDPRSHDDHFPLEARVDYTAPIARTRTGTTTGTTTETSPSSADALTRDVRAAPDDVKGP